MNYTARSEIYPFLDYVIDLFSFHYVFNFLNMIQLANGLSCFMTHVGVTDKRFLTVAVDY